MEVSQVKGVRAQRRVDIAARELSCGLVNRLSLQGGYGFIRGESAKEIYFNRRAVTGDAFDRLEVGTEVRFEEAMGYDGPQASTVQILGKPGHNEIGGGVLEPAIPEGWRSSGRE